LRTIEYARAGLVASSELRWFGTEEDIAGWREVIQRINHLGGRRSRGSGQVRISPQPGMSVQRSKQERPGSAGARGTDQHRLTLLLRNLEPLLLTASSLPNGNLLPTWTHISGSAIRGSLLTALRMAGIEPQKIDQWVADASISFGPAYPIATDARSAPQIDLRVSEVVPMPLTAAEPKATALSSGSATSDGRRGAIVRVPWWADSNRAPSVGMDRLAQEGTERASELAGVPRKRIRALDYMATWNGQEWFRIRPRVATVLRNRTPAARFHLRRDSRVSVSEDADLHSAALFTEEVLVEDQLWLCELRFRDSASAEQFAEALSHLLSQDSEHRTWLRMGRGGRPVEILKFAWHSEASQLPVGSCELNVLLTSDLIALNEQLLSATELDIDVLTRLLGIGPSQVSGVRMGGISASESTEYRTYDRSADRRAMAENALRRGSVLQLQADNPEALAEVAKRLLESQRFGLGERCDEGLGRLVLNSSVHERRWSDEPRPNLQPDARDRQLSNRESVLSSVQAERRRLREHSVRAKWPWNRPGISQWQQMRHALEAALPGDAGSIQKIWNRLRQHAERKSGRDWKPWLEQLEGVIQRADKDPVGVREFLIALARWQIVELKSLDKSNKQ